MENNTKKLDEEKLKELREEFLKIIPQLEEIQRTQGAYREIKEKTGKEVYPFVHTESHSNVGP